MDKLLFVALLAATALSAAIAPARADTPGQAELLAVQAPPQSIWLDSLDLHYFAQDWGKPMAGRSVTGNPMRLAGQTYPHGIGTHANSTAAIVLGKDAGRFVAMVGIDDESARDTAAAVSFRVVVDGRTAAATPVLTAGSAPRLLSVDLTGASTLELEVIAGRDGINGDHADWAGAMIVMAQGARAQPRIVDPETLLSRDAARMTVPVESPAPGIHGARIVGSTPGRPFLYLVPATGRRPLTFSAVGLPNGLSLNKDTGIISGSLASPGVTLVKLQVRNAAGVAKRTLTIVGGEHKLALTPPMGWNSWNVWAGGIDQSKVMQAADAMVASGLAAHGYEYVNIDDTWEGDRNFGKITTNDKFPDMKALADHVHGLGLRIGIYSSPGPRTCGGYTGSYRFETEDANSYAQWGMDYLKYDWCSYRAGSDNVALPADLDPRVGQDAAPYAVMRAALDKADRDIVYSFCQYGMGDVWKWGAEIGGNLWRTTGDINDSWNSMHNNYESEALAWPYAGPGHWNDPDMLVVGMVGWGAPHPNNLTPNEQVVHMTMWCLLAAPLLIGCDMTNLDPLTLNLLTNDEAIDVDQDPLGVQARKVPGDYDGEIWWRPLADGGKAVGLINPTLSPLEMTVKWSWIGLSGRHRARDLWLHQNLGAFSDGYTVTVPAHGAVMLRVK